MAIKRLWTDCPATSWKQRALTNFLTFGLVATRQAAAHNFPYVPTQVFLSDTCFNESTCSDRELAYIFSQNDAGDVEFLSLDYSSSISSDATPKSITKALPFLANEPKSTAFGAVRTANGSVVVYSGACDSQEGALWSYSGGNSATAGAGWIKKSTATKSGQDDGTSRAPFFLGGTISFSTKLAPKMDQPTIYTYGGMCLLPETTSSSWQSTANYTKTMMSLAPEGQDPNTDYEVTVASTSGPRTPIAGFTLTQLPASITNISGTVTQQAGFVLLGGHTQQAFINMSTAAVWNLPEQSWTYINVQAPSGVNAGKELVRRDPAPATDVDSRSGHTAVLSGDGNSILVMGGWVGDVNTPADPQLVVLQLSQTYSSWTWSVPSQQPDGVYGHGAALLPGNIMMVYGGWQIQSDGSKSKRKSSTGSMRFLNITSMSWSDTYANPNAAKSGNGGSHDAPNTGDTSATEKRLGLGLGLGLGLLLLLGIILGFFLWRLKQNRQQGSRDEAVKAMAQDAKYFLHDTDEMAERDDYNMWYASGQQGMGDNNTGYESMRGARASLDDGGRQGILRKPVPRAMRGGYLPAENRFNAFVSPPGRIHPIMEDDEEDHGRNLHHAEPTTPTSEVPSDPFMTPTATAPPVFFPPNRGSATPSPEGHRNHDPEVQDWVYDVDAADALLTRYNSSRQGRISPTRRNSNRSATMRDDESRTGSNLSESNRSAADSLRRSPSNRGRSLTGTAAGFFGGAFLGGSDPPKPGSSSSSSYNTARSGFGTLQAEGPSLLGGTHPTAGYEEEDATPTPGSPSKSKPPRRGWLGSLRRVFSTSGSTSPETASREESPTRSFDHISGGYEHRPGLSGELLRRKQGRQDWADGKGPAQTEDDWDVERAVEQRLVQVMFTVPKERLRVVNGAEEDDDDTEMDKAVAQSAQINDVHEAALHQPFVAELVNPSSSSQSSTSRELAPSPDREREAHNRPHFDDSDLLHVDIAEPRLSHSTDDSGRRSSGAVFTAETVTFERPRTRVLDMVDTIESRSQSNSPTRGLQ